MPAWIHAQYFGNLWTFPVPGRNMQTFLLAEDWADTLSIWIYPSGALSTRLGHREEEEGAELTAAEFQRKSPRHDDEVSQRQGLLLLQLLKTNPHTGQPSDDAWEGFVRVLASSGDLLTSLTYAVSHPLAEDLHDLSLEGVESVYGVLLNYTEPAPPMRIVTMTLVSEGLLAAVLDKTLVYCQDEESLMNVNAAEILLSLSLRVPTTDARICTKLSQAVLTLCHGWTKPCQDLLAGWLHAALFKFPWLLATVQRANITPFLLFRAGVA